MNREGLQYVEKDIADSYDSDAHERKSVCVLVMGILSIALAGLVGCVLGCFAVRVSERLLAESVGNTLAVKLTKAGRLTGMIGAVLSMAIIFLIIMLIFAAALVAILLIAMRFPAIL